MVSHSFLVGWVLIKSSFCFVFFVLSKAEGQEIQAFNVICEKKAQVDLN